MSRKRRNHSPEFKSKVALAAIKGDQTLAPDIQQRKTEYGARRHYPKTEAGTCCIRILIKTTAIYGGITEGLRGEDSIAELCRREGINSNVYYRWSKEFLEAGKKRLSGDTAREATSDEVKQLRTEATALKETLAELLMGNRLLKKSVIGSGAAGAPEDDI